jgi:hypothetical protein
LKGRAVSAHILKGCAVSADIANKKSCSN